MIKGDVVTIRGKGLTNPVSDLFDRAFANGAILDNEPDQFAAWIARWSSLLRTAGLASRLPVGLSLPNGPACVAAYAALARLDLVAVPLPPAMPEDQRRLAWLDLGCTVALLPGGLELLTPTLPSPAWPADIHWIVHSSGSSGRPKAIPVTWTAITRNAHDVGRHLGLPPAVTHVGSMSYCYTNGLYNSLLLPLILGHRALVYPVATGLELSTYVDRLRSWRPEVLWVNPTVLKLLARRLKPGDLNFVRYAVSCTAPLALEEAQEAERALAVPVLQSYGLSETMIVTIEQPGRALTAAEFSSGLSVAGPETLLIGTDGRVDIANGAVFPGYATLDEGGSICFAMAAENVPGRLFRTQDGGTLDMSGRLRIGGRTDQVINLSGHKIGAEAIEEHLRRIEGVADVMAVPLRAADGGLSAGFGLLVMGTCDADHLSEACVDRFGAFARPRRVRSVTALPLTSNGKYDRATAARLLQCEEAKEEQP